MTAPDGKLKVFISWSMPLSHDVAKILRDWLPRVIQDLEPWVSSEDIEKGTYWTEALSKALDAAAVGIIVVTPENHERTWLNFEAGALARSIKASGGMVTPLLIDIDTTSIQGPMTTLQITNFTQEEVSMLLAAVNDRTRAPLTTDVLNEQIALMWLKLEGSVEALIEQHAAPRAPKLADREILAELLVGIRELRRESSKAWTNFISVDNASDRRQSFTELIRSVFGYRKLDLVFIDINILSDGTLKAVVHVPHGSRLDIAQAAADVVGACGPFEVEVRPLGPLEIVVGSDGRPQMVSKFQ